MANEFFNESEEQSRVKSTIVAKYFMAWANVVKGAARKRGLPIAYVDLFAGRGRYEDGTASTPLLVLESAIADPDLSQMLVTVFNDADPAYCGSLESEIDALPGIEKLRHRPRIHNSEVGEEITTVFEQAKLVPTLSFVDPWGYKGLSLRLVNAVLKDWGCDCIFFFNFNRINMGLGNDAVGQHIDSLFTIERAAALRKKLSALPASERESQILEELTGALKDLGGEYVLPFRFCRADGRRTSHHLVFTSKDFRGYDIMKGIMARESSSHEQGVARLEYNAATKQQPMLFELGRPLEELAEMLLLEFAGESISFADLYKKHSVGRPFTKPNYRSVLLDMEMKSQIVTDPSADKRRRNTFADRVVISFPK